MGASHGEQLHLFDAYWYRYRPIGEKMTEVLEQPPDEPEGDNQEAGGNEHESVSEDELENTTPLNEDDETEEDVPPTPEGL